jgi:hypothetical protein
MQIRESDLHKRRAAKDTAARRTAKKLLVFLQAGRKSSKK